MTLLWFDGLESKETSLYTITSFSSFAASTDTRFSYGSSMQRNAGTPGMKLALTASSQMFAGGAWKSDQNLTAISFWGDSGATQHILINLTQSTHTISIARGGTTLATSAAGVWQDNVWFYIEASCTVADSGGTVEVRINGNSTPVVSFTGDTKNAGTSTNIDAVQWEIGANGTTSKVDDIYACNSSGSSPSNTFLGDVRVASLFPTGAGSSTGLTASTGSNWQTVDESPAVSTDYSGSPTSGARDTYATDDLPSGASTVYGARLCTFMHKSDAGAKSMKPAIKVGANVYYGATQALPTTMGRFDDTFLMSPATSSAWTVSEINGAEIGAEVV